MVIPTCVCLPRTYLELVRVSRPVCLNMEFEVVLASLPHLDGNYMYFCLISWRRLDSSHGAEYKWLSILPSRDEEGREASQSASLNYFKLPR